MTREPITDRQKQVFDVIVAYINEHGYSPSIRDIGNGLGISSTNGVMSHLEVLRKKGWIAYPVTGSNLARAITVVSQREEIDLWNAYLDIVDRKEVWRDDKAMVDATARIQKYLNAGPMKDGPPVETVALRRKQKRKAARERSETLESDPDPGP
jgi:SOS-response transcriptional repressor LexA